LEKRHASELNIRSYSQKKNRVSPAQYGTQTSLVYWRERATGPCPKGAQVSTHPGNQIL